MTGGCVYVSGGRTNSGSGRVPASIPFEPPAKCRVACGRRCRYDYLPFCIGTQMRSRLMPLRRSLLRLRLLGQFNRCSPQSLLSWVHASRPCQGSPQSMIAKKAVDRFNRRDTTAAASIPSLVIGPLAGCLTAPCGPWSRGQRFEANKTAERASDHPLAFNYGVGVTVGAAWVPAAGVPGAPVAVDGMIVRMPSRRAFSMMYCCLS